MITDIPDGKNINSIDVSTNPPSIVYDDIPSTEMADIKNSVDGMNSRIDSIMSMLNALTVATIGELENEQISDEQFNDNNDINTLENLTNAE